MIALDRGFFDGSVHPFDLPVCPGRVDLSEPMSDIIFMADTIKDVSESAAILLAVGKLNTLICQHRVNLIRNSLNHVA